MVSRPVAISVTPLQVTVTVLSQSISMVPAVDGEPYDLVLPPGPTKPGG